MSHARQDIRDAVIAALKTANISGIGDKVYGNRVRKIWNKNLPVILVYTRPESSKRLTVSTQELDRRLQLAVEVRMTADSGLDDDLDDVAAAIETVFDADPSFGNKALSSTLIETEPALALEDTESPIGGLRLTYEVHYITTKNGG
jgi:hypothetical protein